MISSKLFTISLSYKIKSNRFEQSCNELVAIIKHTLDGDEFKSHMNIIAQDVTINIDNIEDNKVNIIALIYATIDTTDNMIKKIKAFIDTNASKINIDDTCAVLLRRRAY